VLIHLRYRLANFWLGWPLSNEQHEAKVFKKCSNLRNAKCFWLRYQPLVCLLKIQPLYCSGKTDSVGLAVVIRKEKRHDAYSDVL